MQALTKWECAKSELSRQCILKVMWQLEVFCLTLLLRSLMFMGIRLVPLAGPVKIGTHTYFVRTFSVDCLSECHSCAFNLHHCDFTF